MAVTGAPHTHNVHGGPSDHLANERTFLAWLRTAVSLFSFGITLNRFSIYLQQSKRLESDTHYGVLRDSANVGVGMVILGMVVMVGAAFKYNRTSRRIVEGTVGPDGPLIWSVTIAVLLLGGMSLAFLFR